MRKQSQRAQAETSMTTEYQERFAPPRRHMAAIPQKGPNPPLKASSIRLPTAEWIKGPSVPPKCRQQTCSSAPHEPVWSAERQRGSKVEDYTSVHQNEFRAWKANRQHPFKLTDCLRVSQGLVVPDCASDDGTRRGSVQDAAESKVVPRLQGPPFVSITSYRSDYVSHPAQPRGRREKPVYQPNGGLFSEPAESARSKVTRGMNQLLFPQRFKTVKAGGSSPPADHAFLSAADADITPHRCHCTRPLLPSLQTGEREKKPFQATTTMKEDYKAWNTRRRLPTPVRL